MKVAVKKPTKPRMPAEPELPTFEVMKKVFIGNDPDTYEFKYNLNKYNDDGDDYDWEDDDQEDNDFEFNVSNPYLDRKMFINLENGFNTLDNEEKLNRITIGLLYVIIDRAVDKLLLFDGFKINTPVDYSKCIFGRMFDYHYDGEFYISIPIVNPNYEAETQEYNEKLKAYKVKFEKYQEELSVFQKKLDAYEQEENARKKSALEKKQESLKKKLEALDKEAASL